jgi:glutathione synthase/RimK-type ligase-like ATP-grasp enzyme
MVRDLGILWEWEYDGRFIMLLDAACGRAGKGSYLVSLHNLGESIERIERGDLQFKTILDRATDTNDAYLPIIHFHKKRGARIINDPARTARANDKVQMHRALLQAGLHVPFTLIVSQGDRLEVQALDAVGTPFVIKPADGGGGDGVVLGAETVHDVIRARA